MANYECASRTNYFKVTDPEKLKELVEKIDGAELWEDDSNPGFYAFGGYGSITGYYDEETGEDVEILEDLQTLLPEGEAAILFESGHEKLRYVTGNAIVVTRENIQSVSAEQFALKRAREMLGNLDYNTKTAY